MLNDIKHSLRDLQANPLSDHRFDESHERFEGQSNQQKQILEWLQDFGRQQIERRMTKGAADALKFRVLSVGCGSGILDLPLIKTLADQVAKSDASGTIHYTGIDPNSVACDRFRNQFRKLQIAATKLTVLEETVESYKHDQQIDLTHVVHALYYFAEPAVSLQTLVNQVADDGELVIFQAPKAELNLLADCFWQDHLNDPIWFSADLEQHLNEIGSSFTRSRLNAEVDITDCFEEDCPNGRLTFDFIVQSDCEKLPVIIRGQVLDYLRSISKIDGNRVLAPHPVDAFVIHQTA